MKTKQYLLQLVKYNHWANTKLAEVLQTFDDAVLDQEVTSSFSSIRKTVYHIWDAEFIWLSRLEGVSLTAFPSKSYGEGIAIDCFLETSKKFLEKVETATDDFFELNCSYKNIQQKDFRNSHTEIIMHCMNHSTYHRGQLITLLRQAGCQTLPSTDLIAFLRN